MWEKYCGQGNLKSVSGQQYGQYGFINGDIRASIIFTVGICIKIDHFTKGHEKVLGL
jgi:hypothetical protein